MVLLMCKEVSSAERIVSQSLRQVLANLPNGERIPDSQQFGHALIGLGRFIPEVIGEIHKEMQGQGLDDVFAGVARKTGEREAEILGICCFLSGGLTPFHLHLQVSACDDEISWLECRLGERGEIGMVRLPCGSSTAVMRRLASLEARADGIDWFYKVTFGHRTS